MAQPTASCLIIGDEILTGKVHDTNSYTLAKRLFVQGIRLAEVQTIPDTVEGIVRAVTRMSAENDHVFTSGGIGPTHDDLTLESVAKAFDLPLAYHEPTLARMRTFYERRDGDAEKLNTARKKMAQFPEGAEVIHPDHFWVPVVRVRNVWVLPGVPTLFARLLDGIADRLVGQPWTRRRVYTLRPEGEIAEVLTAIQADHPEIAIGSYPHYGQPDHNVMVTLEGLDAPRVQAAADRVAAEIDGFFRPDEEPAKD